MKRQRRGLLPSFDPPCRRTGSRLSPLNGISAGAAVAAPESAIRRFTPVWDGVLTLPSPRRETGAANPPCRECRLRPSPKGLGRAKRRGCGDCVLPSSAPGSGRPRSPAEMSFFGVYLSNQHNDRVDQRRGEVPSFAVSIRGIPKGERERHKGGEDCDFFPSLDPP